MQAEIMALRHQLMALQRTRKSKRLALKLGDRCLWVWLLRLWSSWRSALIIVKPETVSWASRFLSACVAYLSVQFKNLLDVFSGTINVAAGTAYPRATAPSRK